MVISSLIVDTDSRFTQSVDTNLRSKPAVEVHGIQNRQIIVTIETETVDTSHKVASSFVEVEGVLGVNLVYVNFEDDPTIKAMQAR